MRSGNQHTDIRIKALNATLRRSSPATPKRTCRRYSGPPRITEKSSASEERSPGIPVFGRIEKADVRELDGTQSSGAQAGRRTPERPTKFCDHTGVFGRCGSGSHVASAESRIAGDVRHDQYRGKARRQPRLVAAKPAP